MANSFVTELDPSFAPRLREDLLSQGFELTTPPYTLLAARKVGVSCTLYESGKLVVQGKQMKEFVEFYLEPQILGHLAFSNPHLDLTPRIGCDEAGKGDFFGPLCIAGVYASSDQVQELSRLGVADSKTLGDPRIDKLARSIRQLCAHHIIVLRPEKYNELYARFLNLNALLAWAHASVIETLVTKTACTRAIVDQFANNGVLDRAVAKKKIEVELIQRTGGESDVVVAAASILARDAFVHGIHSLGEEYGMILPKGAGAPVLTIGRQFIARHGRERLRYVAKLHFKTLLQIEN